MGQFWKFIFVRDGCYQCVRKWYVLFFAILHMFFFFFPVESSQTARKWVLISKGTKDRHAFADYIIPFSRLKGTQIHAHPGTHIGGFWLTQAWAGVSHATDKKDPGSETKVEKLISVWHQRELFPEVHIFMSPKQYSLKEHLQYVLWFFSLRKLNHIPALDRLGQRIVANLRSTWASSEFEAILDCIARPYLTKQTSKQ